MASKFLWFTVFSQESRARALFSSDIEVYSFFFRFPLWVGKNKYNILLIGVAVYSSFLQEGLWPRESHGWLPLFTELPRRVEAVEKVAVGLIGSPRQRQ